MIVARLRIGIRHGGQILRVVRRILQKPGKQIARLLILFRIGRFPSRLVSELLAQFRVGVFRRLQQDSNGLRNFTVRQ